MSGPPAYDDLGRLASFAVPSGPAASFAYVYDRYGNRWQQNVTSGSGPAPQFSFDEATNHINSNGYAYDAAGNMISDGFHAYTYDAEGNVTAVDGGTTARYVYNAVNERVEITTAAGSFEYLYDAVGHWISQWLPSNSGYGARIYWGNQVLASRATNGYTYFEGKDWLGTDRMRTDDSGATVATYTSLPFGAGDTVSGSNADAQQDTPAYAMLDFDSESSTHHATFRQYSGTEGRWMSPDPYSGSYDPSNPQSFNRYSYVLNSPLAMTYPTGQDGCSVAIASSAVTGIGVAVGGAFCAAELIGSAILGKDLLGALFGGPSFHGSLKPRPNTDPWSEHSGITYGPDIAGAFGLPDPGCDFGVCGAGPSSFESGVWSSAAYPNGNDPNDLDLFGGLWDSFREVFGRKKPSPVCIEEAKAFQAKYVKAASHSRALGFFGGLATVGALKDIPGGAYLGYQFAQSQIDAAYSSALRSCMAAGR